MICVPKGDSLLIQRKCKLCSSESRLPASEYVFYVGQTLLSYSAAFKNLGFVFQENIRFSLGRRVIVESSGKALGFVVNKMIVCPYLRFPIFTWLYD